MISWMEHQKPLEPVIRRHLDCPCLRHPRFSCFAWSDLISHTDLAGRNHALAVGSSRHTYASEMLRVGVSLPAVKELLGYKEFRMSLRYIEVTQNDLQREFHTAR